MAQSNSSGGGISFAGVLTILFITLKLTGTIDWSWWWVLSPIWISLLVVLVIVAVAMAGAGLLLSAYDARKKRRS